jgi:penicillin-insensitive murein endopeptidase
MAYWFKDSIIHPKPEPPKPPPKLTDGIKLSAMPAACKAVLNAPDSKQYGKQ